MLKTIIAVALLSVGAHAQQNATLSNLQAIQFQKEEIAAQREQVAQDRQLIEATQQALSESQKDAGNAASGVLFGRIVTGGGAVVYGVPVLGRLYLDTKGLIKGEILPENFMKSLSLKQVVLGLGSIAAIFAVDKLNNLYVLVEKAKWPEAQQRLAQKRQDLALKERVLKKMEFDLQQRIAAMGM